MSVQQILDRRRQINKQNLENRIREVCEKTPRICQINSELKEKNIQRMQTLFTGENSQKLSREIEDLIVEKKQLLVSKGYPIDYLELKYHCDICKDTGTVGTTICECRKKLKIEELYNNSEIKKLLKEENFDKFDLSLFRRDIQGDEEISPFENMKSVKDELEAYAKHFDTDVESIFIYGTVGTGKTYLLNSIAKEVLDLGHSVIYLSEAQLVNDIMAYKFAYENEKGKYKEKYDMIMNCDLLIIDDLGANMITKQTQPAIFEVVNTRMVKKLPVVISSNLTPNEIDYSYGSRISSRIVGGYFLYKLYGNDVRMR